MRRWMQQTGAVAVTAVGLALISAGLLGADKAEKKEKKDPKEFETLMRKKLRRSQDALEALALEDFDKIKAAGADLKAISLMDEWKKYDTPAYNELSDDFRKAVERMNKAAEEKNLDGATIGFVQATMSCVDCHKLIRGGGLATGLK